MGLVTQVFDEEKLRGLRGEIAIGHARYSTTGSTHWSNAQPVVHHGRAHRRARSQRQPHERRGAPRGARAQGVRASSTSDSELIAALLATDEAPLTDAVANAMQRLDGAYSCVALAEGKRSPSVIRSASGRWCSAASATTGSSRRRRARSTSSADYVRDVERGEVVLIGDDGLSSVQAVEPRDNGALHLRVLLPRAAGHAARRDRYPRRAPARASRPPRKRRPTPTRDADPDSGTPAAIGFSRAAGIPFSEGLIKNRYVGRTFIQPEQGLREQDQACSIRWR